jgi:hypothetical protein
MKLQKIQTKFSKVIYFENFMINLFFIFFLNVNFKIINNLDLI